MALEKIEKACAVSRAVVYHAVRKIAERDDIEITPHAREKKLTNKHVENIKKKLSSGALRKVTLADYSISSKTLIKNIGTSEDYKPVSPELKIWRSDCAFREKTPSEG